MSLHVLALTLFTLFNHSILTEFQIDLGGGAGGSASSYGGGLTGGGGSDIRTAQY